MSLSTHRKIRVIEGGEENKSGEGGRFGQIERISHYNSWVAGELTCGKPKNRKGGGKYEKKQKRNSRSILNWVAGKQGGLIN